MALPLSPQSPRQWITSLPPNPRRHDLEEEHVLAQAAQIMEARMRRQGQMDTPEAAAAFLQAHLGRHNKEMFYVLCMDTRHRILGGEVLFTGTIDSTEVHPREVAKLALRLNAAAVILAHNHPSGDTTPSTADRAITQRLKDALALIDVRLLDHLVVSYSGYTSLAARGWV